MKNARQAWDDEQIARAVGYTTSRFLGRGRFDTRRFETLPDAFADARGDRRAIVYAVTPEGFTIHITNGDTIAKEPEMTDVTIKTYASKSNCIRAARVALKGKHQDPLSGVHFRLEPVGDEWAWHEMDLHTGEVAVGELVEDGTRAYKPLPQPESPAKESREQKRLRKIAEADARNAARAKAAKERPAAKAPKAPRAPGAVKSGSKRAEVQAAAERGEMPAAPDFSADTHKRFRPILQKLVDMAAAGDIKGLKADTTQPASSSRVALCRYRDLSITALEAQKRQPKAA